MIKEYKLPDLGEGIHEGEVVEVLVSVGDRVEDGQTIMVIETDKAASEVPSPVTGVVDEIRVKPGETVKVGDVLMTFRVGEEAEERAEKVGKPPAEKRRTVAGPEEKAVIAETPGKVEKPGEVEREGERAVEKEQAPEALLEARGPVPASPSTRRLARDLGVDLRRITPTGPSGQVTPEDVRSFAEKLQIAAEVPKKAPSEKVPEEFPTEEAMVTLPHGAAPLPDFAKWGPIEREPLRSVRKVTARQMAIAWSNIPHVTHTDIADITELEEFRRKHKAEIEHQGGALSLTVFALKAAAAALRAYPRFNSSLDTEKSEIVLKRYIHIGVAVDTDRGLIVPVIRDVDRKSITELAGELEGLVRRARDGKTERDELVGGTFTITNIGSLGGTGFAPIINYPQVAILGLAQARLQPVVRSGSGPEKDEIVPRLMLPLILGFDHRVVDGADAARFMNVIVGVLGKIENLLMLA